MEVFLPATSLLLPGDFSERQIRPYRELDKGVGLGFIASGGEVKAALDTDTRALHRVQVISGCQAFNEDLSNKAIWNDLPATEGVTAGIPCITYSRLGKRLGPDDPRDMHRMTIDYFIYRVEKGKRYDWIVFEIVPEMLEHPEGIKAQREAVRRLREVGYVVGLDPTSDTGHDIVEAYMIRAFPCTR